MTNKQLLETLLPTYDPCEELQLRCKEMLYDPFSGHIPRGFYGASGELGEVQLVMILMEPTMPGGKPANGGIWSALEDAKDAYLNERSVGHQRVRRILRNSFPGLSLPKDVMRRVWITESVLCSKPETGIRDRHVQACVTRYLVRQLELIPNAIIAAMEVETYRRVSKHAPEYKGRIMKCHAPFGYRRGWSPTWDDLAERVRRATGNVSAALQ